MGLCRFYRTSPKKSNVLTGPKSTECAHRIYGTIEIAKRIGRQLTVVVFNGESVSPVCLLQELHSHVALMDHDPYTSRGRCGGMEPHILLPHLCVHH